MGSIEDFFEKTEENTLNIICFLCEALFLDDPIIPPNLSPVKDLLEDLVDELAVEVSSEKMLRRLESPRAFQLS